MRLDVFRDEDASLLLLEPGQLPRKSVMDGCVGTSRENGLNYSAVKQKAVCV